MRTTSAGSNRSASGAGPRAPIVAGSRGGRAGLTAAGPSEGADGLLRGAPPACPPSLANRAHPDSDLFHYYALRGHAEVLGGASAATSADVAAAVRAAVGALSPEERQAVAVAYTVAAAHDNLLSTVNATTAGGGGIPHPSAAAAASLSPRRRKKVDVRPVAPPRPASPSQPLFPRLRPSAEADHHTDVLRVREAAERRSQLQARARRLNLPPSESHFAALYRPKTDITAAMEDGMAEVLVLQSRLLDTQQRTGGSGGGGPASPRSLRKEGCASPTSPGSGALRGSGVRGVSAQSFAIAGPVSPAAGQRNSTRSSTAFGTSCNPAAGGTISRGVPNNNGNAYVRTSTVLTGSPGGGAAGGDGFYDPVAAARKAALLRESRAYFAAEVDDVFVGTYYAARPEARAKELAAQEAAARRRSTRSAAEMLTGGGGSARRCTAAGGSAGKAKNKKRKKSTVAKRAPRCGEPPENMRFIKSSLLTACDESGQVCGHDVELLLTDTPFEVRNTDALRDLLQMIRQVTEAPQRLEMAEVANTFGGGGGGGAMGHGLGAGMNTAMDNSLSNTSRRSIQCQSSNIHGAPGTSHSQVNDGSGRLHGSSVAGPSTSAYMRGNTGNGSRGSISTVRNATTGGVGGGAALAGINHHPSKSLPDAAGGGVVGRGRRLSGSSNTGSLAAGSPCTRQPQPHGAGPRLLVRELLGAVNALVNGDTTRNIVRWTCFNTLAAEGQGFIHKSTLQALRESRREECEGPQAELTASIVKALNDAFAKMAAEEEADYIKKSQKGKRKKKSGAAVKLAPNQNSVIPLGVMRRSHMGYEDFCRYFDELPQLCAAFMHVWLGMLVSGRIGAEETATTTVATPTTATTTAPMPGTTVSITDCPSHDQQQQQYPAGTATPLPAGARRTRVSITPATSLPEVLHSTIPPSATSPTSEGAAAAAPAKPDSPGTALERSAMAEVTPGTFPITLLGASSFARRAAGQSVVHDELAIMREVAEDLSQPVQVDTD